MQGVQCNVVSESDMFIQGHFAVYINTQYVGVRFVWNYFVVYPDWVSIIDSRMVLFVENYS